MIIESVQVGGFGCITGEYKFSRGINLVIAGNESGKTTLADALVAILYGIKCRGRQSGSGSVLARRYSPVCSDSFAGSAVVKTSDGRRLNIWRDFALGKLRVLELASGRDITLEFDSPPNGDCLGERLTGLSANQYRKLACLSQDELNKNWDFIEFVDTLSALFSSDDHEGVSIEEAKAALQGSVNLYEGVTGKGRLKVETEIKRLEDRISEIDREISEINSSFQLVEKRFEEAADKRLATDKIKNSIKKYDYFVCLIQRNELAEKLEDKSKARLQIDLIEKEIADLTGVKDFEFENIEHIAELMALYADKNERVSDIKSLKDSKFDEVEYLKKRVENLGKRSNITQDYLLKIEQAIAVLENNLGRERSVRIDCRSAEKLMIEAGIGSDEIRRFNKWKDSSREVEIEFVTNYNRIKEQIENKEHGLQNSKQEQINMLKEIAGERLYRYKFYRNNLVLGCMFTGLSVFFFVAMGFLPFMLIPALVCLSWAVFAAVRIVGTQNIGKTEEDIALEELSKLEEILAEFPEKFKKMEEKLDCFSSAIGVDSEGLLKLVSRISKARREIEAWEQRIDRHKAIEAVIEDSYSTLREVFSEIGIAEQSTHLDITRARVFMREVSDALSLIEQYETVSAQQDDLIIQESELLGDMSTLKAELDDIFARAGVEVIASDFPEALKQFKERLAQRQRLEQLEDINLPTAIEAAGDIYELETLESEIATWDSRILRMLKDDPWLEAYQPEQGVLEYNNEIKLARLKLEDTEGELVEREKALAIEEGRRRERLPLLSDEKAQADKALGKAKRFKYAITQALSTFDNISSELHSRWSPMFSEEFNDYIARFSSKVEFSLSKELKLCGVLRENGHPIDTAEISNYLSKGMRDQVYLSLRLLLTQKVARDEALPVILDDPFINADDRRFREGMEQLLEFSKNNQIFIFSCHELRHEALCNDNHEFATAKVEL